MISAKHSIVINRPIHEVFEYLCDYDKRMYWHPNLVSQEHQRLEKGARVNEVRNVLGRRVEIEGEITEFVADIDLELTDAFELAKPVIQRMTDRELDNTMSLLRDVLEMEHAHAAAELLPQHHHHRKPTGTTG